ncbi:hypothetical protein SAMN04489712_108230 [Thermomonospora echinospora]|uniref:Uncharacterized protein n=1 Tax=Thermomonospora echinospora TaxID=1992 RepID=A0A1H6C1N8_9ACTN|nr:hypothetical protein [Thermomonospora echinospora]SEG66852.1 hypothetical protein SAMN04489712_108230 [Thermomonospora echinospora]
MLAIVAAIVFGLALLFDLADIQSDPFDYMTMVTLGLLFLALHLAGVGATSTWRTRGRARR